MTFIDATNTDLIALYDYQASGSINCHQSCFESVYNRELSSLSRAQVRHMGIQRKSKIHSGKASDTL